MRGSANVFIQRIASAIWAGRHAALVYSTWVEKMFTVRPFTEIPICATPRWLLSSVELDVTGRYLDRTTLPYPVLPPSTLTSCRYQVTPVFCSINCCSFSPMSKVQAQTPEKKLTSLRL